jgi:hypothetical protein
MTRVTLRSLLVLTAVLALAAVAAGTSSAATGSASGPTVPVTGTTSTGGTFAGVMTVTGYTVQNGQLMTLGTVSGTTTDAAGNTGSVSNAPAAAPTQAAPTGSCTLVSFSFGPFDVNAAGLVTIHIDPIAANVTINGILGSILCGLLSGGVAPPPAPAVPALPTQ